MLHWTAEIKANQERLSRSASRFLDFVANHPQSLEELEFKGKDLPDWVRAYPYRLQSWPTFLGGEKLREAAFVPVELSRLIQTIPERIFDNDFESISEFYSLNAETTFSPELLTARYLAPSLARGDFIDTESGLQCLEVNHSAQIGGWQLRFWRDIYLSTPFIKQFLLDEEIQVTYRDPFYCLLQHIADRALAGPCKNTGALNVALTYTAEFLDFNSPIIAGAIRREFQSFLQERYPGLDGEFLCCHYSEIREAHGGLQLKGIPIHAVIEYSWQGTPRFVQRLMLEGSVHVYNGPACRVTNDKRNLALLSEYADAGLFDPEESAFIARHVPWTRLLGKGSPYTTFRGERVLLDQLLTLSKDDLVIKRGASYGGKDVYIGRVTSKEEWTAAIDHALAEGVWVVQESVTSVPYIYQNGPSGWSSFDVIWGLFSFGDAFGGGFLRMMPVGIGGVINSSRGATEGIFFEVDEEGGPGASSQP